MSPVVHLVASIDTEEDNWLPTRNDVRVENIQELPSHHRLLRALGLKPTYFADHPVVADPAAAARLAELEGAELGAHLHPWNTPPLDEALTPAHTMLRNLPAALQRAKLAHLVDAHEAAFGRRPTSFRAGRFGLGRETVAALIDAGFEVDSSVVPFVSWQGDEGPDFDGAPVHPYRLDGRSDPRTPARDGPLCEIPLSAGFTRRPFGWRSRLHRRLSRPPFPRLRMLGLASRLGLARRVIVSPETDTAEDMLAVSRQLVAEGASCLQIFWHSPSLVPGLGPFVREPRDRGALERRIEDYVSGLARDYELRPVTVSEAAAALLPPLPPRPGASA